MKAIFILKAVYKLKIGEDGRWGWGSSACSLSLCFAPCNSSLCSLSQITQQVSNGNRHKMNYWCFIKACVFAHFSTALRKWLAQSLSGDMCTWWMYTCLPFIHSFAMIIMWIMSGTMTHWGRGSNQLQLPNLPFTEEHCGQRSTLKNLVQIKLKVVSEVWEQNNMTVFNSVLLIPFFLSD